MRTNTSLQHAIANCVSLAKIGEQCGVSNKAVARWRDVGYLPASELSGVTTYGVIICGLSSAEVTNEQLLAENREYRKQQYAIDGRRKSNRAN